MVEGIFDNFRNWVVLEDLIENIATDYFVSFFTLSLMNGHRVCN